MIAIRLLKLIMERNTEIGAVIMLNRKMSAFCRVCALRVMTLQRSIYSVGENAESSAIENGTESARLFQSLVSIRSMNQKTTFLTVMPKM